MAGGQLTSVLAHLRRIIAGEPAAEHSDAELLGRFLNRRDADAFAQLVERHGPLVWNVCVRVLQHDHDAEDAFQATFLILARKARSIQKQPSLASWLYGVAYRTATRAKQRRKNERERAMIYATNGVATASPRAAQDTTWQDLRPILDEEVNQLPEKYRTPVVLCYFEGKTNDEAARTLGWPKGTVAGRLARARDLLRQRLSRRGLAFSSAGLGSLIAANAATASMPGVFLSTIPPAALAFAAGKAVPLSSATAIAEGVMHAMFITKLRIATAICVGAVLLALGGGTVAYRAFGGDEVLVPGKGGDGIALIAGAGNEKAAVKPRTDAEALLGTWVRIPSGDPVKVPAAEIEAWLNRADLAYRRAGATGDYDESKLLYEAIAASDNYEARQIALNRLAFMRKKATPTQEFDKVIFTKDLFQFCFDETKHDYAWKIDATKSPKELDIIEKQPEPGKAKQKPVPCIYKLDGDTLEIAFGTTLRPNDFAKAGKFGQHYVLKREQPAGQKSRDHQLIEGTWVRVPMGETPQEQPVAGGRILQPAQHARQLFAKIIFRDNKMTFVFPPVDGLNAIYECIFSLDTSKSTKELDFTNIQKGGGDMPYPTNCSLYELDGDTLHICMPLSGTPRPEGMNSQRGTLYSLKREKAAEKPKTDEELIQGRWKWTRISDATGNVLDEETYVFRADRFWVIRRDGQEFGPFRFRLDTSKFPREFDGIVAMEKGEQRVLQGLYALDASTLKLGLPMRPEVVDQVTTFKEGRPKSFDSAKQLKTFDRQGAAPTGAGQTTAEKPKTDEELIQGAWRRTVTSEVTGVVKEQEDWFFKDNRVYRTSPPGSEYGPYRFTLVGNADPVKRMRVTGDEVLSLLNKSPGSVAELYLFYEIKGDTLRIARQRGPGVVLKEFPPDDSDRFEVKVFTRQGEGKNATTIPLRNTAASEVATILQQLFMNTPAKPTIVADPRTNTLILQGTAKQLDEIKQILDKLDALGAKPPQAKPVDPTQPGALTPRARDIVKEMIETAKSAHDLTNQQFMAGKGSVDELVTTSRRVGEAHALDPKLRKEFIAALEAHVQRMKGAETTALIRFEAGRIPGQEAAAIKYARLEAELWLEREKAKPRGQLEGQMEIQRMRVAQAEATLAARKERLTWSETLLKRGFLPKSELSAAEADVRAAGIALAEAKLELERLAGDKP